MSLPYAIKNKLGHYFDHNILKAYMDASEIPAFFAENTKSNSRPVTRLQKTTPNLDFPLIPLTQNDIFIDEEFAMPLSDEEDESQNHDSNSRTVTFAD